MTISHDERPVSTWERESVADPEREHREWEQARYRQLQRAALATVCVERVEQPLAD